MASAFLVFDSQQISHTRRTCQRAGFEMQMNRGRAASGLLLKAKNQSGRPLDQPPILMEEILRAILDDDRSMVMKLLKAAPALATCRIEEPRLYQSKIFHWIYAGDIALHLAAAGHRVELARLFLAAGADPNSRKNHRQSGPLHYAADGYITGPDWNEQRQVQTI